MTTSLLFKKRYVLQSEHHDMINHITKRQLRILLYLYQFRFLDTHTIQLLMQHVLPTRIQQWLHDLVIKGYVHQFYDRSTLVGRTKPAVYCLSTKSNQLIKQQEDIDLTYLRDVYREKHRSEQFRNHWCYIGQLYSNLKAIYNEDGVTFGFFTKNELHAYKHFPQPLPDAFIKVKEKGQKTVRYYFLELFDVNLPKKAIQYKIKRYIAAAEGEWNDKAGVVFPSNLIITANTYRQKKVVNIIKQILEWEYLDITFFVTNQEIIETNGLVADSWQRIDNELA